MLSDFLKFFKKPVKENVLRYKGLNLPPFRSNQGLQDNNEYVVSGIEQLNFLKNQKLLNDNSEILDFGCGQGRMVNALEFSKTRIKQYTGVDTSHESIAWCQSFLSDYTQNYKFIYLPAYNARYNNSADGLKPLPFTKPEFDLIFLNSVFSHMSAADIGFYLKEFKKVLKDGGRIYATAFIEENVAPETENPEGYLSESSGPLHRVRYEKNFFFSIVKKSNLYVDNFIHREIKRTNQSVIIIRKDDY